MKPKMTAEQARRVLAEYPDADLSAFDTDGLDLDAIAAEECRRVLGMLAKRAEAKEPTT